MEGAYENGTDIPLGSYGIAGGTVDIIGRFNFR